MVADQIVFKKNLLEQELIDQVILWMKVTLWEAHCWNGQHQLMLDILGEIMLDQ